jgi:Caspase domain
VFGSIYNFSVTERRLTLHKGPAGHQMNAHLANFILSEDTKDSLLIIYYAGHGVTRMKDDNLVLVGFVILPLSLLFD